MSYNSQVEAFVVGDLVCFIGYELENPPLSHKIGIVTSVGSESRAFRSYGVFWIRTGATIAVDGNQLVLAYTEKI